MSNRFTERSQRVVLVSQEEAKRLNHDYVGTEHLLLGIISLGEGVASQVLSNLGVDFRRVRSEIEKVVGTGNTVSPFGELPFTPRSKKVLEYASNEAQFLGFSYVGTEHLLLGLIQEGEGVAARVLENLGLRLDLIRVEILRLCGPKKSSESVRKSDTFSDITKGFDWNDRLASLFFILIRQHLPMNEVQEAIQEARHMKYSNKEDPFYKVCSNYADDLFDI